jgi:4-hydroxybenzoate polyprenyltransferase/phosphoserine phosphatase
VCRRPGFSQHLRALYGAGPPVINFVTNEHRSDGDAFAPHRGIMFGRKSALLAGKPNSADSFARAAGASGDASLEPPLVVDLDGTLVSTDLLLEAILRLIKDDPLAALRLPLWLLRGRATLKRELANRVKLETDLLPYRTELCTYLREEHSRGRRLILASANDELFAGQVAAHLGFFDRVIGSNGVNNLKGANKRDRLVHEFGERGFDYAGDARSDLFVWSSARLGIVVSRSRRLRAEAARRTTVGRVFEKKPVRGLPLLGALRTHHWLKNVLIFVPLLATHRVDELDLVMSSAVAFGSFCLLASGLYVFNDLLDLNADRRHPRKRFRPIPAGELPLAQATAMVPILVAAAFGLAWRLPPEFLAFLALYCGLALAYSLRLKRIVLLDVIVLACLYVIRVLAGAAAVDVPISRWLLGFSMFVFLSLALLKRYTEIVTMRALAGKPTQVRGYRTKDASLLTAMGSASGYLSVVILALYADSATATRLYARNELIWLVCPVFLYWISYLWLMAHRNRMAFDPVIFAVRNRTSHVLILIMFGIWVLAV